MRVATPPVRIGTVKLSSTFLIGSHSATAAVIPATIATAAAAPRLMVEAGLVVITAFISPFRSERDMARAMFDEGEFVEVYLDVPLSVAEDRDPKGLYKKARRGELPHFTGIDSPYEEPDSAEIHLPTHELSVEECVERILPYVR